MVPGTGHRLRRPRAVSDEQHTRLSPWLGWVLRGGRVSAARLTAALLCRPALALALGRLAANTRLAAVRLAAGLGQLLDEE
jgi:hypothetical protein